MSARRVAVRWGASMVIAVVLAALVGPLLYRVDPTRQELESRLAPPSSEHRLGQDELGRDILARVLVGARVSLFVGVVVVAVAAGIGTTLGGLAGYLGGWVDVLLMRLADVLLAFPGMLLAIALVAVLGPGLENVVIALVAIGWVGYARLVRGQVLTLREQEFVAAARAAGASRRRVLWRHVIPNVVPVLVVQASLGMAGAIVAEAGLSFLGLGVQPPDPSWGSMIDFGRSHLLGAPHLALFPGLAIVWTVVGFNLLGDGLLRDAASDGSVP